MTAKHPAPDAPKTAGRVTVADVQEYPHYYIVGDGRPAADQSYCTHGYRLTASCPNCP